MKFFELMKTASNDVGLEFTELQYEQFIKYMRLLQEWNEKINLTAITEDEEVIKKHFIDCIKSFKSEPIRKAKAIIDVGTGAGFPGLPIAIMNQNVKVTLLDSLNKRINFLKEVIRSLQLENIEAIHGRAEEFCKLKQKRENYDIVSSRAVAKLNVLLEYMLPFVKIGGKCICMKSSAIDEELNEAQKAIEILGGRIEKVDTILLENTNIERKIVIIEKIKSTPEKYPRKAGTPVKEPIC